MTIARKFYQIGCEYESERKSGLFKKETGTFELYDDQLRYCTLEEARISSKESYLLNNTRHLNGWDVWDVKSAKPIFKEYDAKDWTIKRLMDNLPHDDFIHYMKDNF